MNKVVNYDFKWIWLVFDIIVLTALFKCFWCFAPCGYTWLIIALLVIAGAHLGCWLCKYASEEEDKKETKTAAKKVEVKTTPKANTKTTAKKTAAKKPAKKSAKKAKNKK